jgi:cytochrome P450
MNEFPGYLIPKGWKAQLWYRTVHMDPQVYPDPKKFDPSRWEVGQPSQLNIICSKQNECF